jgi:lipopolysaccharide export LptBFGC system permease protein LptF
MSPSNRLAWMIFLLLALVITIISVRIGHVVVPTSQPGAILVVNKLTGSARVCGPEGCRQL